MAGGNLRLYYYSMDCKSILDTDTWAEYSLDYDILADIQSRGIPVYHYEPFVTNTANLQLKALTGVDLIVDTKGRLNNITGYTDNMSFTVPVNFTAIHHKLGKFPDISFLYLRFMSDDSLEFFESNSTPNFSHLLYSFSNAYFQFDITACNSLEFLNLDGLRIRNRLFMHDSRNRVEVRGYNLVNYLESSDVFLKQYVSVQDIPLTATYLESKLRVLNNYINNIYLPETDNTILRKYISDTDLSSCVKLIKSRGKKISDTVAVSKFTLSNVSKVASNLEALGYSDYKLRVLQVLSKLIRG